MEQNREEEKILVKGCPNCGEVINLVWGEIFCRYYIKCQSCGCRSRYGLNTSSQNGLKKAVEYWNNKEVILPTA